MGSLQQQGHFLIHDGGDEEEKDGSDDGVGVKFQTYGAGIHLPMSICCVHSSKNCYYKDGNMVHNASSIDHSLLLCIKDTTCLKTTNNTA